MTYSNLAAPTIAGIQIGTAAPSPDVQIAENGAPGRVIGELVFAGHNSGHNFTFEFLDWLHPTQTIEVPFEIVPGTGDDDGKFFFKLKANQSLDYETNESLSFTLKITDNDQTDNNTASLNIGVDVHNINEAPTAIDFGTAGNVTTTVSRNAPTGTAFQSLRTIDQDTGDTHTYAIVIGNNSSTPILNSAFAIGTGDDAGKLVVRHAGLLAALSGPQTLWIQSTDSGVGHLSVWTQVTVNVAVPSHENHAPTGVEILINEDNPTTAFALEELGEAGRFIGRLSPIDWDDDDSSTFEIVDQNSPFEVFTNEDGITSLKLKANTVLDREAYANGTFTLHIKVTDGAGASFTQAFTVSVGNVNEAPTDITLSKAAIAENSVAGTEVGILATMDQDFVDSFTFSLADNAGGAFKIENGKLVVADASKLDYETATSHKIKVKVTDAGGLSFEKELVVGVTDVAENVDGAKKNDKLVGGVGADILDGKLGKDTLTGGFGKDAFVFSTKLGKSNVDKITDFKVGEDMIYLDNAIFKKLGKAGSLASPVKLKKANFVLGDKAKDKDDYVGYDSKKGVLWYDSNGSATGGQETIATLSKKLKMTVDHFFIV
ncbi:hypothetical protein [Microvirga sp. Mcv34]|uniref:hypothetical protein n=1 Tax=Microvirga sp. Mcv34 TaxID=2926016 RepID=UPI0021C81915|nr:hypothetical protein [Microvirga sp. Mcv34]